jgi:enoyl-CoA hydratase
MTEPMTEPVTEPRTEPMTEPVTVTIDDGVAVVRLDDGKRNAISPHVVELLHEALDSAERDDAVRAVCIIGRPGTLSAGFDLKVMTAGADAARELVQAGAEMLMRLYLHPQPTVVAVTGHALAAGALVVLACDTRIGADIDAKIGLNEVAIGMSLPIFAVELARDRLGPAATRAAVQAELADPMRAVELGYLDRVVAAADCEATAIDEARRLGELRSGAYGTTKRRLRQATVDHVLATLAADMDAVTGPAG